MIGVELDDVSVQFRVQQQKRTTLKEYLLHHFLRPSANPTTTIHALRNVTLRFNEGERVGIVGHNGAGKSTLLKLICRIYAPTGGQTRVNGRVANLLNIGLGLNLSANGWTNIELLSYLQGATPGEVKRKRDEIAEFTELGKFLDLPISTYSVGMIVRLCFAVSTSIEPEILVLDEILSAGDAAFQVKARARLLGLIEKTRLLVFASHDLDALRSCCNRLIWMKNGAVERDGSPAEVIDSYYAMMVHQKQSA